MNLYFCIAYKVNVAASKIGLPRNRLRLYEQKTPTERFQSAKIYSTSLAILYSYWLD